MNSIGYCEHEKLPAAIVLAGGEGTRLRPLTLRRPKPIIPLVNRPFLHYQLNSFLDAGVSRVILTLSYRPDVLQSVIGEKYRSLDILYSVEEEPMGTAGAIARVKERVEGDVFVTNGDVLSTLALKDLLAFHREGDFDVTILLTEVEDPGRYGVVALEPDNRIHAFVEKPSPGEAPSRWINAGIYILSKSVIDSIPDDRPVSIEREVFPSLISSGRRVGGYRYGGYWVDVGTIETYRSVHRDYLDGKWGWQDGLAPGVVDHGHRCFWEECKPDDTMCRAEDSIIFRGFAAAPGVKIKDSIIAEDVEAEEGAEIINRVIEPGATVPAT